jgi:hypothetical protein
MGRAKVAIEYRARSAEGEVRRPSRALATWTPSNRPIQLESIDIGTDDHVSDSVARALTKQLFLLL